MSVREAIRVLEALGLVEVRTGAERGATLRREASNAFADILRFRLALGHLTAETVLDFRLVLQVWAAGRSAERRDEAVLRSVRDLVRRMETEPLGPNEYQSVDVEFHLLIGRGAQNELATLVFEAIRHSLEHTVLDTFLREADWRSLRERLTTEHRAILAAIETGKVETSKRLIEDHIRGFWHREPAAAGTAGRYRENPPQARR